MKRVSSWITGIAVGWMGLAWGCSRHGDATFGEHLIIVAWNVESSGSDGATIARQLGERPSYPADIYCLSEVDPSRFETYCEGAYRPVWDRRYARIDGTTGQDQRLQILYDPERFTLIESTELSSFHEHVLNDGGQISPIVALFRDRMTGNRFWLIHHQLACDQMEVRSRQAVGLRELAREKAATEAVVVIGDLCLEYDIAQDRGGPIFEELEQGDVLRWVRPNTLIDTSWNDQDGDRRDDSPSSILSGAFVGGRAKQWYPTSLVIAAADDFPDDESKSDQRPVSLWLRIDR